MKVELPVIVQNEIIDGKREFRYEKRAFELDVSLNCEMRWEANFPQQAEVEDLISYTERVCRIEKNSLPVIVSKMKTVYCYFATDLTFNEFLKMFDFTNGEYLKELIDALKSVFDIVFGSAVEKN